MTEENKKISPKEFEKMSGEEVDKKITEEIKDKEISAPLKFNPGAQKYELDMEKINEKVKEINKKIESKSSEEKKHPDLKNKKAEGSFTLIIFMMLIALLIASLWEKTPAIKNSVHYVLNPSAGFLLDWNLNIGMLIVVLAITLLTTIVQKYATDQKALKELKKEQKEIQKQMKEFKAHPEKYMELQKKSLPLVWKQMKLSMHGMVYMAIPFIFFFRW